LVWLVSQHYIGVVIGYFQLGRRIGGASELLYHGLPLLLGLLTFLILRANQKSLGFATDATAEMAKVSWPSAKETRVGTIVVIITVLLAGMALGLLDMAYVAIIRGLIGL
jgi:preprotein translocase SecE subunit